MTHTRQVSHTALVCCGVSSFFIIFFPRVLKTNSIDEGIGFCVFEGEFKSYCCSLSILLIFSFPPFLGPLQVLLLLTSNAVHLARKTSDTMAFSTTGSIFGGGGFGSSTAAPPSTSIFSSTNQPSSIFGSSTSATTQPAQSAPLSGLQQPAQSSTTNIDHQAGGSSGGQTQPGVQATQPAFFNSLLERGKKRPTIEANQRSNFEELPGLQLGLGDIRRKARELGAGGQERDGINNKA